MKDKPLIIVGTRDKQGRKVIAVSPEGWYRTEDGSVRDADGFEWFGDEPVSETEQQRVMPDDIVGQTMVVRDFKIAVLPGTHADPKEFFKHYRPTIEQTMVETGWDYADDRAVNFGMGKDGFVHIYVKMKKRSWKNKENTYSGAKQGQSGAVRSKALQKIGALDPTIYGVVETGRKAEDILAKRK
jgi:hypothetical protein